jgi:hypothetical protein
MCLISMQFNIKIWWQLTSLQECCCFHYILVPRCFKGIMPQKTALLWQKEMTISVSWQGG